VEGWGAFISKISHQLGMRENPTRTPPETFRETSVKLSIDTHLLYGYSCGAGQN